MIIKKFNTEEKCATYLFGMKWPNRFVCPICVNKEFYFIETRKLYECKQCNHQTSLTARTVMHKIKLSLRVWFLAIYLIANDKRGKSALSLSKELKINYRTSWRLLHKIRHAMGERDDLYNLSEYIEMDDAYIGVKKKGKRGRGTEKPKIAVALSTDEKGNPHFLKIKVIEAVSTKEMKEITNEHVQKGSKIITDGYPFYKYLNQDYIHMAQNYSETDSDEFLNGYT